MSASESSILNRSALNQPTRDRSVSPPVAIPPEVLREQAQRGAGIRLMLRVLLVLFFVAVLAFEPPVVHLGPCWVLVGAYLAWTVALGIFSRTAWAAQRLSWLALFVDLAVLAALTLLTDTSAAVSWTPYLLITGFFLMPVLAAAQLNPWVCVVLFVPAIGVYLIAGLLIGHVEKEPLSYILLTTGMLATLGLGAIALSRLQRSRVTTIAGLLAERTSLLNDMVGLQQREQRQLAETLHDGALQYVLGARQELDDAVTGDPDAGRRIDYALGEASRLLRSTMTQLHPAVLDSAGLESALTDLVEVFRARGRFAVELEVSGGEAGMRTNVDGLLLTTTRELLTNVVKHAGATRVTVRLDRDEDSTRLQVGDDGVGMSGVELDDRVRAGHIGIASRRVQVEASGGTMTIHPAEPHGTVVEVTLPTVRLGD